MYTQCPECHIAFRVSAKILQQAGGRVQCGGCGNAFNAVDYLSEVPPVIDPALDPVTDSAADPVAGEAIAENRAEAKQSFEERSTELLKALDDLAGPEDIRIEDTGVEWRVLGHGEDLDEVADDMEDDSGSAGSVGSVSWYPDDAESNAGATSEVSSSTDATADRAASPDEPQALEIENAAPAERRYDDSTPLPDNYGDEDFDASPMSTISADDSEEEPEELPLLEDAQVDLELGDPDEWLELLDEEPEKQSDPSSDVDAPADTAYDELINVTSDAALRMEAEEELAAIHSELSATLETNASTAKNTEDENEPPETDATTAADEADHDESREDSDIADDEGEPPEDIEIADEQTDEDEAPEDTEVTDEQVDEDEPPEDAEVTDEQTDEDEPSADTEIQNEQTDEDEPPEDADIPDEQTDEGEPPEDAEVTDVQVDEDEPPEDTEVTDEQTDEDEPSADTEIQNEQTDEDEPPEDAEVTAEQTDEDEPSADTEIQNEQTDEDEPPEDTDIPDEQTDEDEPPEDTDRPDEPTDEGDIAEKDDATEDEDKQRDNAYGAAEDVVADEDGPVKDEDDSSADHFRDQISLIADSLSDDLDDDEEAPQDASADNATLEKPDSESVKEHDIEKELAASSEYDPDSANLDQTSEDYTVNLQIHEDMRRAMDDEQFAATMIHEDGSPLIETIIMEGDFVRGSIQREEKELESKLPSDLEEPESLIDTYVLNRSSRRKPILSVSGKGITAGVVILALLLASQYVHTSREFLATYGLFNQTIGPIYRMLGSPVTPAWDIKGWQFETTNGSTDEGDQLLTIYSRISNRSSQALPYPLVHVSLTDRWEEIVGSRVLEPNEYLAGNPDPRRPVAAGDKFTAVISIAAPAAEVTGFKLIVCYRVGSGSLSCAIEDFKN